MMENSCSPIENESQITEKWLTSMLELHFPPPISLKSNECKTPSGREGFLSEIAYVSLSFRDGLNACHELSLVFKFFPKDPAAKRFLLDGRCATKESSFYNFAKSKEFEELCLDNSAMNVIPKVYYCSLNDSALTMVFENMSTKNFKIEIFPEGSNLKQTKEMLYSIAFIHAAGIINYSKTGSYGLEKDLDFSFFNLYLVPNMEKLCKMYTTSPFSQELRQMLDYTAIIPYDHRNNPIFETTTHGDLWAGQCLVSPDGEVCILDWQFANVDTPVLDLMCVFFMSTDPIALENNLVELVECYWQRFSHILTSNKVQCPATFETFLQSVEENWMTGFMYIIASLKDFLSANNITQKRLDGYMNFLHKKKVFRQFIDSCSK